MAGKDVEAALGPLADPEQVLSAFNALDEGEKFQSVSTLPVGVPHAVLNISRISTKHGEKLKARVAHQEEGEPDIIVILPSRFAAMSDDALNGINALADVGHPYHLAFTGRDGNAFKVTLS